MKKTNVIFILLCLAITAKAQKYNVHIELAEARQNAKAYLQIGAHMDTTAISNGTATFEGEVTSPQLVYVYMDYKGEGHFDHYYYLYLFPGTTNLKISDIAGKDSQFVTGNKYAVEFNDELLVPVSAFNPIVSESNYQYMLAKQKNSADSGIYLKTRNEAVFNCFQIPQKYVKNNPSSPLCIMALKMLGKGDKVAKVNLDTLRQLFMSLTDSVKSSEEGVKYEKWLASH